MLDNLDHSDANYALAVEHGRYLAALRHALRALRRAQGQDDLDLWRTRASGCFRRRHDDER